MFGTVFFWEKCIFFCCKLASKDTLKMGGKNSRPKNVPAPRVAINNSAPPPRRQWNRGRIDHEGSYYEGELKNGLPHGEGTYVWNSGHKYVGKWIQDQMHGQGVYSWPDGRVFTGNFAEDCAHGQGKYDFGDGSWFQGNFTRDKIDDDHGVYCDDTGYRMQVSWHNLDPLDAVFLAIQQKHEQQRLHLDSSKEYHGAAERDGTPHGTGILVVKDSRTQNRVMTYEGEFKHGQFHGRGRIMWHDIGCQFSGIFNNGQINGHGSYSWEGGEQHNVQWMGYEIENAKDFIALRKRNEHEAPLADTTSGDWLLVRQMSVETVTRERLQELQSDPHFNSRNLNSVQPQQDSPATQEGPEDAQDENLTCLICLEEKRTHVMVPCGHVCLCDKCSQRKYTQCPVCRAGVTLVMKIYLS